MSIKSKSVALLQGKPRKTLHDAAWIEARVDEFAKDIASQGLLDHALIVGIRRRGAELARRVCEKVSHAASKKVPLGALDITLYRDDVALRGAKVSASKQGTALPESIDNRVIYLVDDVLCTGRTIRAALSELMDFGRPGAVRLYSLIDRGGRELPIQPDRVGERLTVPASDLVDVRLKEVDGEEGVYIIVGGMR